jgi:RNA polymerase sigma factor (sigma-70 family)
MQTEECDVNERDWLAERFEDQRAHLHAVAYRMLGSLSEADDAVQDTWLRFSRADCGGVENLGGWLTTMVARACLDLLRSRHARREEPLDGRLPEPIVSDGDDVDPEQQALLADAVGLALLVVLDTLTPAERLAFVLHDMFAVPFGEIAPIVGRSQAATRQLASRARRRVRDGAAAPDTDLRRQREVVEAFFAASHAGDFDALVAVLDPDVVLRADPSTVPPGAATEVLGAKRVAEQALMISRGRRGPDWMTRPALVNGAAGVIVVRRGQPFTIMGFTVRDAKIVEIYVLAAAARSSVATNEGVVHAREIQ